MAKYIECGKFGKRKSLLNTSEPALVSGFRNYHFVKEVATNTPFLFAALQVGVKDAADFNRIALGAAACLSTRTQSSAYLTVVIIMFFMTQNPCTPPYKTPVISLSF